MAATKADQETQEEAGIEGECPARVPRRGVYFLANEGRTRVKIGKSTDIDHRIRDLGRMNADPLVLLAEVRGYTEVEKWMHRRFAAQRTHGEWFAMNDEIRAMVDSANADRDVTEKLCAGAVKLDDRARVVYEFDEDDDPLNPTDRDPVGDEGGYYGPELPDADLIVALVNAAPQLLRIARAAEAWRDADDKLDDCANYERRGCKCPGEHDTTNAAECWLAEAEWSRDQAAEQLRKALAEVA